MADPACSQSQTRASADVVGPLGLPAEELGNCTARRRSEVGDETVDHLLCGGCVITDRKVDHDIAGNALLHVLPRNERIRNERVLGQLDLVAKAPSVLVVNLQAVVPGARREPPTLFGGTGPVERLRNRINGNGLRISEQDNSLIGVTPGIIALGGYSLKASLVRGKFQAHRGWPIAWL